MDVAALGNPDRPEAWLSGLSVDERLGLDSRIDTQVLLDQEVRVLGRRGAWSRIEIPDQRGSRYPDGIVGWVPTRQLSSVGPAPGAREVIVSATRSWLHALERGGVGPRWLLVSYDTELPVVAEPRGYVEVALPGNREGAIADADVSPVLAGPVSGTTIVTQARRFLGLPYLWGGTSAFGYDCSGLVYAVYARYGVILPRDAADQRQAGAPVRPGRLEPGDLLFFAGPGGKGHIHHVAIYAGAGLMIDAPYTGASVEIVPMASSSIWGEFSAAVRPPGVT